MTSLESGARASTVDMTKTYVVDGVDRSLFLTLNEEMRAATEGP